MELKISFEHGLGDCVNFAHTLELFRRRGFRLSMNYSDDKEIVFAPLGITRVPRNTPGLIDFDYPETGDPVADAGPLSCLYNKTGANACHELLPHLGQPHRVWEELTRVELNISPFISAGSRSEVAEFLKDLPKPVVLLHSMGNTFQDLKNIPPETALDLYRRLLDSFDGTLVLLDWDDRVPRISNWRVRHMTDDWHAINVATLVALLDASDLLISIDSGPLHLARLTNIPVIGVFPSFRQHPARVSLPRGRTVNVVPRGISPEVNRRTRIAFNIVESPKEGEVDAAYIADVAARMLSGPRYLPNDSLGSDLQLQQFVLEWERGKPNGLTDYNDRHRCFDVLLREIVDRFDKPVIVETGCIREAEDWQGAGYSTYVLGAFTHRFGGTVTSVDHDPSFCEFARDATREMSSVTVVHGDSVRFLEEFEQEIDVLFLDSMDAHTPGHEEHALREAQVAARLLHSRSIIVLDDAPYNKRGFTGKGALAIPYLLESGWRILHSGYQTILVRGRQLK